MASLTTFIALGSNLGDRLANLRLARELLGGLSTRPIVSGALYETAPVDCPEDSPAFLNTVIAMETELAPHVLHMATLAMESQLGRDHDAPRHSPRTIDLDLLLMGETVLQSETLTLPHPRLHERLFVLQPLRDLAPTLVPPSQANPVSILLEICPSEEAPLVKVMEEW